MRTNRSTARLVQKRPAAHARERIRIIATNSDLARLCAVLVARFALSRRIEVQDFAHLKATRLQGAQTAASKRPAALVVSRLSDLQRDAWMKSSTGIATKQLLFLDDLPAEALAARLCPLNIRDPQRIHIVDNHERVFTEFMLGRLLCGLAERNGSPRIVDAWIEEGQLVLLSPEFARLKVPLEKLAHLIGLRRDEAAAFQVDVDGRFLHWPHADVHLGWVQLQHLVDPASAVLANERTADYNRRYGAAIRNLREASGLKQADISGVTERQLRRVEHGEQSVSKKTLEALARAHSRTLADYLSQVAQRVAAKR